MDICLFVSGLFQYVVLVLLKVTTVEMLNILYKIFEILNYQWQKCMGAHIYQISIVAFRH